MTSLRQSGRTTALLRKACERTKDGHVAFVVAKEAHLDYVKHLLWTAAKANPWQVQRVHVMAISRGPIRLLGDIRGSGVIAAVIDHYAWESSFADALSIARQFGALEETKTAIAAVAAQAIDLTPDAVDVLGDTVSIDIEKGVTFAMMSALSRALATERINVLPAQGGSHWSSNTYDEGHPARLVATIGEEPARG